MRQLITVSLSPPFYTLFSIAKAAMEEVRAKVGVPTLRLRIGLHSGPITAGVIRAQNRRFQLFGDTVLLAFSSFIPLA